MGLKVNVRQVVKVVSDIEDEGVAGLYEVNFNDDIDVTGTPLETLASMALDVFHSSIGIGMLDDFDIDVCDEQNKVVHQADDYEDYSASDCGSVEKVSEEPVYVIGCDDGLSAAELDNKYNPEGDGEHPTVSRSAWRNAVACEETISGYWSWVEHQLSLEKEEIMQPVLDHYGKVKNSLLTVAGERFRCSCGCNVFHQPDDARPNLYECNSCEIRYTSEE